MEFEYIKQSTYIEFEYVFRVTFFPVLQVFLTFCFEYSIRLADEWQSTCSNSFERKETYDFNFTLHKVNLI